jgi:hypothetical protein
VIALLLTTWAFAQGAPPAPTPPPAPTDEEIVVYGQLAIDKARDAIVAQMEGLGYRPVDRGDNIVFRPPKSWMGKAILHDDGRITFTRPLLALQGAEYMGSLSRDLEENVNVSRDGATGAGGVAVTVVPEKKKLETVRLRVEQAVQDELDHYVTVVRGTALQELLATLPDRLDATWTTGAPIQASAVPRAPLDTPEARRQAILEFWASRTDTDAGHKVCKAVEAWMSATIQESEHPITDEERARYEARRSDGRTLPE